jgi:hypothetical protein
LECTRGNIDDCRRHRVKRAGDGLTKSRGGRQARAKSRRANAPARPGDAQTDGA